MRQSSVADFGVRYFTPAAEIPLAGHPTIATSWALVESGRAKLTGGRTTIMLELQVGSIRVDIATGTGGAPQITMTQKKPEFLETYDPAEVASVFGLQVDDIMSNVPVQTVSTGTPQLMIPLRSQDALRRAHGLRKVSQPEGKGRLLLPVPVLFAGLHE